MPQNVSANGGLSLPGAVWRILKIQALALSSCGAAPCRESFLIGKMPSACFLASLLVLRPHGACTERGLCPVCTWSGALPGAAGACRDGVGWSPGDVGWW
jgi:hypothetical protein